MRWRWFFVLAGISTLVIAALVVFGGFRPLPVFVFGWLPLVLVLLFAALFSGRPADRRRWPAFGAIAAAAVLVSGWLAFVEGLNPVRVGLFATLPFLVLMLLVTLFFKRRVAPYRVAQIISAIALNAYVLAFLQEKILFQGIFKHVPQPILNCYGGPTAVFACPIGSTQQMLGMRTVPWLALGLFVITGALVGRAACAWVCPFGLWQDLLHKIPVGRRAKAAKPPARSASGKEMNSLPSGGLPARSAGWLSFGVVSGVAAAVGLLLVLLLGLPWLPVLLLAWLPFTLILLYFVLRGKLDIPPHLHPGGALAAVGLGVLVWFRFEPGFGVLTAAVGLVLLGLTGGRLAALLAAQAAFLFTVLGPGFGLFGLSGAALGLVLAGTAAGLVLLFDRVIRLRLPATNLKYWLLLLVAGLATYLTVEPWFCKLCPQGALGAGIPLVLWDPVNALRGLVGWLFWVKVGFLLLIFVTAVGIKRPFCRLVCPIGAIYALFNKVSLLRMELTRETCSSCGLCKRVCPMDISAHEDPNQAECIRCFECAWRCPPKSLKIRG